MDKITLNQLLQYYENGSDLIQIVTDGCDWGDAEEFEVCSALLKQFYDYRVTAMRCEESYNEGLPVLRVLIEKGENENEHRLEEKADLPEVLGCCLQLCWYAGDGFRRISWNCGKDHGINHGWCYGDCLYHRRGSGGCCERERDRDPGRRSAA